MTHLRNVGCSHAHVITVDVDMHTAIRPSLHTHAVIHLSPKKLTISPDNATHDIMTMLHMTPVARDNARPDTIGHNVVRTIFGYDIIGHVQ